MRVLVCTVVHNPADARILHRQIRALLDAGHDVTYIAPFRHCRVTPWAGLEVADVPRATGRHRFRALIATRRALAHHAQRAGLLVIHDPELLPTPPTPGRRPPAVWDVHEDTAAAIAGKAWIPWPRRRPLAAAGAPVDAALPSCPPVGLSSTGVGGLFKSPSIQDQRSRTS